MTQTTYADRMRARLTEALAPTELEIEDQSEQHRGHGGYREGGETHFHVSIRSAAFDGLNRVQRQRLVHKAVAAELEERVHALSLTLKGAAE
ncbi:BolA family protein [Rhodovulum sp. DZ06]|uniref:BolA family protein n=1 Tax=Rhodovulum sp. DZ06 TaxID=3425126 RepID=UPI003D3554A4